MNIKLHRGDTKTFKFKIIDSNGDSIENVNNIYLTCKKNHVTNNVLFQKSIKSGGITFSNGYYHFVINSEDTDKLDYDDYVFDIEVIIGDFKETKLGTITIDKEVTFKENEV